jgi:hypothetical protein
VRSPLSALAAPALAVCLLAAAPSPLDLSANARAAGNRKGDAVRLARVLLAHTWPAQVLKIRIDAVGPHAVAGLVLSGVKFHRNLDADGFLAEVASLVKLTLAASGVEEVDVWATVPIAVGTGAVVAGDFAQPTSRIVFSCTVRRSDAPGVLGRLRRGDGVFWAEGWKAGLRRS